MQSGDAVVTRDPGVQGGAEVLAGTRMLVGSSVTLHRLYGGSRAEIAAAHPHLTGASIAATLAYYERHHAEVDADEERNARAFEGAAGPSPSWTIAGWDIHPWGQPRRRISGLDIWLGTDEDLDARLVQPRGRRGYDVLSCAEVGNGSQHRNDAWKLDFARLEGRAIVVHHLSHFAVMHRAWAAQGRAHAGVIAAWKLMPLGDWSAARCATWTSSHQRSN